MTRRFSLVPMVFPGFDKEISEFFGDRIKLPGFENVDWEPRIDIYDDKEGRKYLVKVDVPGIDPKDIDVSVDKNTLTIKGKRESEFKEKEENYLRVERIAGSFCRIVTLPELIDPDKITAKGKHGVLEVTIPKAGKSETRKIEVKD